MKIGITLHPYGEKQPAGLAETIYRLSETLVSLPTKDKFIFFAKGADQVEPAFLQGTKHEFRRVKAKYFWLNTAYKENPDIDVWIYLNPMLPIFVKPKRSIVYALDFSFLYLMKGGVRATLERYMHKSLQASALQKATHIVTMSNSTTEDIKNFFPSVNADKITPIYAGFKDVQSTKQEPFHLPAEYYLSIGVIKPRKNQLRVVQAFLEAKAAGLKGKLVLAGKGGGEYTEEITELLKSSSYSDDVIITGYLTEGQVIYVYKNAKALVFPSLIEGFGFPVLEAMSLGVPVITSNTSSLGEVAGEAAICVDPESVSEIADALLKFEDEDTRLDYTQRGKERITHFSWQKTAQKLLQVVQKIQ